MGESNGAVQVNGTITFKIDGDKAVVTIDGKEFYRLSGVSLNWIRPEKEVPSLHEMYRAFEPGPEVTFTIGGTVVE